MASSDEDSFMVLSKEDVEEASLYVEAPVTSPSASTQQTVATTSLPETDADVGSSQVSNLSVILGSDSSQASSLSFVQLPSPGQSSPPDIFSPVSHPGHGIWSEEKHETDDEAIQGDTTSSRAQQPDEEQKALDMRSVSNLIQSFKQVSMSASAATLTPDRRSLSVSNISPGQSLGTEEQKKSGPTPVPRKSQSREDVRTHSLLVIGDRSRQAEIKQQYLPASEVPSDLTAGATHAAEAVPHMTRQPQSMQHRSPERDLRLAAGQRVLSPPTVMDDGNIHGAQAPQSLPGISSYQRVTSQPPQMGASQHQGMDMYGQPPTSARPQLYQHPSPGATPVMPPPFENQSRFRPTTYSPAQRFGAAGPQRHYGPSGNFQQQVQQWPTAMPPQPAARVTRGPAISRPTEADAQKKESQKTSAKHEAQPSYTLPKPQQSELEPERSTKTKTSSSTVQVTGVDENTDLELLEVYFESSRRSGGGNFTNIDDQRSQGYVLITFEDPEVAQRVLSKPVHAFRGVTFDVTPYQPPRTVKVSGLEHSVSEALLWMYFGTEKSGAEADIEKIFLDADKGEALVTFTDHAAVERVLDKSHTIRGNRVSVTLPTTSTTVAATSTPDRAVATSRSTAPTPKAHGATVTTGRETAAAVPASAPVKEPVLEQELAPSTVEVRGLGKSTSKETLQYYFENKRRSGGGPVEAVDLDSTAGVAKVTFQVAEDAANVVAQDQHTLDDETLDVRFCHPPEMMKNAVVLTGLPDLKSSEELLHFVEAKAAAEVKSIRFGEEEGTALIIFKTDIDYTQMQAAVNRRPFKGQHLVVSQVPATKTVLVSRLPQNPAPTEDTLTNYFENTRRSGGGVVDQIQIASDGSSATVIFAETEVAARVADREHTLQNQPLNVHLFMECLGPSGGSEEPTLTIPEPVVLDDADTQKISLLQEVPAFRDVLESILKQHHATLDATISPGNLALVCCLTLEIDGARKMAETWARDVAGALQDFLQSLNMEEMVATRDVFQETEGRLRELSDGAEVGIHYSDHQGRLFIICKLDRSRHVYNDMKNAVRDAQERVQRRENEKCLQVEASKGKLTLLRNDQVLTDIKNRFPHLCVLFEINNGCVKLKGLEKEIQEAKQMIDSALKKFKSLPYPWPADLAAQLQQIPEAENIIRSACMDQDADGVVEFNPTGFEVHSSESDRADNMVVAGVSVVQRWVVKLDGGKDRACRLPTWRDLKQEVLARNEGRMLVTEDQSCVTILGVGSTINQDANLLRTFLDEHSFEEYYCTMEKPEFELFQFYLQDREQVQSLIPVDISFQEDTSLLVIKGSKMEVKDAERAVKDFQKKIIRREKVFTEPSMNEFLSSDNWTRRQRPDIEQRLKCKILDPTVETDVAGAVGGVASNRASVVQAEGLLGAAAGPGSSSGRQQRRSLVTAASPASLPKLNVPLKPRIFMHRMSDITKEEHDVLVNSTNVHLKLHRGQVSSALLKVGGPTIQEECTKKYPQGIQMGDIAVTGSGKRHGQKKLMCKNLIHCCLPETKEAEIMKFVVKDAVDKCLTQTEALGHKSIGFPALGTGTLKYPPDLVAKTMYEAVLEYGRKNPDCRISDVFFILYKRPEDEPVRQAFQVQDDKYKQLLTESSRQSKEAAQRQYFINPNASGIKAYKHFARTEGKVKVKFLAYSQQAVDQAVQELLKCYNEKIVSNFHDVPELEQWDDLHVSTLINACSMVNVDVTFNYTLSRLEVRGFRHNLDRIALHATLREADQGVRERQNAILMMQQVQWSMVEVLEDGEHLVPYEPRNNYLIETGYREGKLRVIVVHIIDNTNKSYNVDFTTFEEVPEDPAEAAVATPLRIIRQDKIQEMSVDAPLPSNWSDMRGQSLDCVPVREGNLEYTQVAESFMRSLNMPAAQIVKIERVQNETLYKQYMAMKQQIKRRLPGDRRCERDRLWHGTNETAADGIIKYGFNRSYSDLDRCAYGQGVYFASDANYSSKDQYAKANTAGERNMFRCKVLIGEYIKGDRIMRFPPPIPSSNPPRSYDSTVDDPQDPGIFVIFSDVQAYPEYRIVFKDN